MYKNSPNIVPAQQKNTLNSRETQDESFPAKRVKTTAGFEPENKKMAKPTVDEDSAPYAMTRSMAEGNLAKQIAQMNKDLRSNLSGEALLYDAEDWE